MTLEYTIRNQRFDQAIAIMDRAKHHDSLCMNDWQTIADWDNYGCVTNEKSLHICGNKACFAGHIAISPEFHLDGGLVDHSGMPQFRCNDGAQAIMNWLLINSDEAFSLVYGDIRRHILVPNYSEYYEKSWDEVNADDVIVKLKELKTKYQTGANYLESQS